MTMTVDQTRQTVMGYIEAALASQPFRQYLSDDIRLRIMNGGDELHGLETVVSFIEAAHRGAKELRVRQLFFSEGHVALEADWVTQGDEESPYTVIYDCQDGKISAIRLYFVGNPPA